MPQKSGLGRGLGALIPSGEKVQLENSVMLVPVEMVLPNHARNGLKYTRSPFLSSIICLKPRAGLPTLKACKK